MPRFLWICLGGAAGTGARYLMSGWVLQRLGGSFPYGTLAVNVLGSFLLGVIMQVALTTEPYVLSSPSDVATSLRELADGEPAVLRADDDGRTLQPVFEVGYRCDLRIDCQNPHRGRSFPVPDGSGSGR